MQRLLAALLFALPAIPCARGATWSAPLVIEESAFQAVHAFDMLQTLDIRHHPGAFESGALIDGGIWIGPHPSDRSVYTYFALEAGAHLAVTALLAHFDPLLAHGWEALTISVNASIVRRNASLGLAVHL